MNSFHTLLNNGESLFKEKGSKHFGYAFPVNSKEEIKHYLQELKIIHPKATHMCYAYKLGSYDKECRVNDDGEPSGSAGKPILGQITRLELSDVLVVVVRYYGGTNLGVSGLQNAYKTAAAQALQQCTIIEQQIFKSFQLQFPYEKQGEVEYLLDSCEGKITNKLFLLDCQYQCQIPLEFEKEFTNKLKVWNNVKYNA